MKKQILVYLMISTLLSCATSTPRTQSKSFVKPEVHGHRGARWVKPENTLPAFQYALDLNVEVLELDLGVTKDSVLVVYHDQLMNPEICRYKNGKEISKKIPLHSLTLKQVKEFDCGSKKHPRFKDQELAPGTEIPTLDEFFALVSKHPNGSKIRFNIEMKSEEHLPMYSPSPKNFALLLIESLRKHKVLDRTIIQSFDLRTLKEARALEPSCTISMLIEDRPKTTLVSIALAYKANIVSPNHEWLTEEDVRSLHVAGVQVAPWTANTEEDWKKLLRFGVDAIITDNPKALQEFLKNWNPNRLRGSRSVGL